MFVWTNGAGTGRVQAAKDGTTVGPHKHLEVAVKAGATILTDGGADRKRSFNVGEREVAAWLSNRGYSETADGEWTPSTAPKTEQESKPTIDPRFAHVPLYDTEYLQDRFGAKGLDRVSKESAEAFGELVRQVPDKARPLLDVVRQFFVITKQGSAGGSWSPSNRTLGLFIGRSGRYGDAETRYKEVTAP